MYSRTAGEGTTVRTFGVSGRLWHGVLVMYDRESESLWTQIDGRAIQGPAQGQHLEHVPSTFTTWSAWREQYPETLVLEKDAEALEQKESHYADYLDDPDRLLFPHLAEGLGGLGPKGLIFGITVDGESLAISAELLAAEQIVNAVVADVPVAWLADRRTGFPIAVDRRTPDGVLVLRPADDENPAERSADALSGRSIDPTDLARVRVDRTFWYAWRRSHPDSRALSQ